MTVRPLLLPDGAGAAVCEECPQESPILGLFAQLFLIGLAFLIIFAPGGFNMSERMDAIHNSPVQYVYIFVLYIISAFTLACSQATIAHIVYVRMHGGDATLGEGIGVAFKHAPTLFLWACITSTVGMVLRIIAERSALLMRIVVALIGAAWSVLTYFVVPAIIIDKKSATDAIHHSGEVFRRTWGETIVASISLSLAFLAFFIVLIVAIVGALVVSGGDPIVSIICGIVFIVSIVGSIIMSSVLDSVLRTLLYIYASENITPTNFNSELLEKMLVRKAVPVQIVQQNGL